MSQKWRRAVEWDRANLRGPFAPVRWIGHALSSIALSVTLLVLISVYGIVASVPLGMLVLGVTWLVIAALYLVPVGVGTAAAALLARWVMPKDKKGIRFAAALVAGIAVCVGLSAIWLDVAWPRIAYSPPSVAADGAAIAASGLRLFPETVEAYKSITVRRLPGVEMTELEFYSWWPMRLLLGLFVVNMVVATVRRIEFTFKNLGVLTVHTGIVLMALGSAFYQSLKLEGDALLVAGTPGPGGDPATGPTQRVFYDNTAVALYVSQNADFLGRPRWEMRRLKGMPRYNEYAVPGHDGNVRESLSVAVPAGGGRAVDPDIGFEVVGYASYAAMDTHLERATEREIAALPPGSELDPVRVLELVSREESSRGAFEFVLKPTEPAGRVSDNRVIGFEYTVGMDQARWAALSADLSEVRGGRLLPEALAYVLLVSARQEDGSYGRPVVLPGLPEQSVLVNGYTVTIDEVSPEPPFPIITEGYAGATSSVAILSVQEPDADEQEGEAYERYVYHRFPELNQDILPLDPNDTSGRPNRRDADPALRVDLLDLSGIRIYVDEPEVGGPARAIVRGPLMRRADGSIRSDARVVEGLGVGDLIEDVVPLIDVRLREAWAHGVERGRPVVVPEVDRDNELIGTHTESLAAVRMFAAGSERGSEWERVVWVPFSRYRGLADDADASVTLPDGRTVRVGFGRVRHVFDGFGLRLEDFEMIAYDHRGAPRDYQSIVTVVPVSEVRGGGPGGLGGGELVTPGFEEYTSVVKLNAPLRAPFEWDGEQRGPVENFFGKVVSYFDPTQFKLSQAGWDSDGWERTQGLADAGEIPRPFAAFTILQVGNNPGIVVIAIGGILMGIGTPWAFYVKPWLVKREKARLVAAAMAAKAAAATGDAKAGAA